MPEIKLFRPTPPAGLLPRHNLHQLIGERIARFGLELVGIAYPPGGEAQNLLMFGACDPGTADALLAVTEQCSGRCNLTLTESGEVAVTFLNLDSGAAVRLYLREEVLNLEQKERTAQLNNLQEMEAADLFTIVPIRMRTKCEVPAGLVLCGSACNPGGKKNGGAQLTHRTTTVSRHPGKEQI